MQLTSLSLALSRIAGGWSPISLFAAGEQGAWYQPSDLSTLFQDSAGTTPVTAVEQRVGLMLDKSKGLALGSENVVAGTLLANNGWTAVGTGGVKIAGATVGSLYSTYAGANRWYKAIITVSAISGTLTPQVGNAQGANITTTGVHVRYLYPTSGAYWYIDGTSTTTATVDSISIREIAGNHAFQATTTPNDKRPILSARVNLLTKTEDFSDAVWVNVASAVHSGNIYPSPNGSNTAARITNTNPSIAAQVYNLSSTSLTNTNLRGACWVKGDAGKTFALTDVNSVITLTGDWQYVSVTQNSFTGTAAIAFLLNYSGMTATTIDVWHPDLRPSNIGSNIPAYQRVNTSTDYDTAGFPLYLKADGTYTSMSTNSINFSATAQMTVVSGVRKLSDASTVMIAEFNIGSGDGVFNLAGQSTGGYSFRSRGTATADAIVSTGYTAPISNIITGQGAISTPLANLRINGTQAATLSASQGTGNYGNYPLYIFARNNASLFFNGQFYGAIIRGATTSSNDLISAESYMNNQSGGLY